MIETLFSSPLVFVIFVIVILASLSFHEFSHALAAKLQGDDTAERMGRLTLNPIAHIDPWGLMALLFVGFGWGKPVPFNNYNLKNQKWGPSLVAVAGPVSNALLILVSALALKAAMANLPGDNALVIFLVWMVRINAVLLFFNLIPIPPLDGSKFLLSALDGPQHARTRFILETRGPIILLGLILVDNFMLNSLIFGTLFGYVLIGISALFGL